MKSILLIFVMLAISSISTLEIDFNVLNDDLNEIEDEELTKEKPQESPPWNEFFWTTKSKHENLATTQQPEMLRNQEYEKEINKIIEDFQKNLTNKETVLLKQIDDTYQTYLNKLGTGSCREESEMKLSTIKNVTLDFYYNCAFRLLNLKKKIINEIKIGGAILRKNLKLVGNRSQELCQSFVHNDEKKICQERFKTKDEEEIHTYKQQLVSRLNFYALYYTELWSRKTVQHCFNFDALVFDFYSAIKMCLGASSISYYS